MYIKIYVLYTSIKISFDLNRGSTWMYMYLNVFVTRRTRTVEPANSFISLWSSFSTLKPVEETTDVNQLVFCVIY